MLANPPMQGGPLRELALRLGFTPGEIEQDIVPLRREGSPVNWIGANTVVAPGEISGAEAAA